MPLSNGSPAPADIGGNCAFRTYVRHAFRMVTVSCNGTNDFRGAKRYTNIQATPDGHCPTGVFALLVSIATLAPTNALPFPVQPSVKAPLETGIAFRPSALIRRMVKLAIRPSVFRGKR